MPPLHWLPALLLLLCRPPVPLLCCVPLLLLLCGPPILLLCCVPLLLALLLTRCLPLRLPLLLLLLRQTLLGVLCHELVQRAQQGVHVVAAPHLDQP